MQWNECRPDIGNRNESSDPTEMSLPVWCQNCQARRRMKFRIQPGDTRETVTERIMLIVDVFKRRYCQWRRR